MRKLVRTYSLLLVALLGSPLVYAADKLEIATSAELLTTITRAGDAPKAIFVPAVHIREAQEVFYSMRVRNAGVTAIDPVVVTKAIPRNTRYIEGSASGPAAEITYSVDNGRTFGSAQQLTMVGKDGRTRRASSESYTHIRWQLHYPLVPGATALVRFRVVFK